MRTNSQSFAGKDNPGTAKGAVTDEEVWRWTLQARCQTPICQPPIGACVSRQSPKPVMRSQIWPIQVGS